MMSKKYELTDETIEWKGRTLHRIRALRTIHFLHKDGDFDLVIKPGDLGGYVETESNLSQYPYDESWISCDGKVYDNAIVCGDSLIENAEIYDNAIIGDRSFIFDNTQVYENAVILSSSIDGYQKIYGTARVHNSEFIDSLASLIYGDTFIESSCIAGYCRVYDNAQIQYAFIENCDICENAKLIFTKLERLELIKNKRISGNSIITRGD